MLTPCLLSLRKLLVPNFIRHPYWKFDSAPAFIRLFSSIDESSPTVKPFIQIPSENDNTFEIYDNPYEQHWEEDPEFDYTEITPKRPFYPFITDQAKFELSELVSLLQSEGIKDVVCIRLPENPLAAFMVIGTGNTSRHVRSTATLIHKIVKHKHKLNGLTVPRFESLDGSCEWIAINLDDIILHLFQRQTRDYYDLESLWSAGSQFDEKVQLPSLIAKQNQSHIISWDRLMDEIQAENKNIINDNRIP